MAQTQIVRRQIADQAIDNSKVASGAGITSDKLADGSNFIKKDGTVAMTGSLNMGSQSITNVEPSTLTNVIGVGNGASDTNLKIFYGGSAAQTPIDLGANFPANTLSTDVYELALFCAPGRTTVGYQVTRLNTGHIASGTLTGTVGTQLPAVTTLLTYSQNWRTNNTTALAVGLDIFSDYIETDQ